MEKDEREKFIELLKRETEENLAKFPTKFMKESFQFIDKMNNIEYCNLSIPAINEVPYKAHFVKNEGRGFNISFEGINDFQKMLETENWTSPPIVMKSEELDIQLTDLFLNGSKNKLKFTREEDDYFSGSLIVSFDVQGFSLKQNEKSFYRQIIKIDSLEILRYLKCETFNIKEDTFGVGLFKFQISGCPYSLFTSKWKGDNYLIIDCEELIDFEIFSNQTYAACVALGFFTCKFFQNECWYIESSEKDFVEIKNVSYSVLRKSIKSNYNPIYENPKGYARHKKLPDSIPRELTLIEPAIFSKLCTEIIEDDKLLGALIIFMEAHNCSVYLRGAGYSVTLETLTQLITDKHAGFKPIVNDKLAREFTKEVKDVLEKYKARINDLVENPKNELVESVRILEAKIDGLNYPTNKDKLSIPFKIYKIDIIDGSDEDKAISHRNSFLHGNNLKKSKKEYLDGYEVWGVTLHLVTLLNKLILKYIGYEGYVINHAEFHLNKEEPNYEILFTKI